MRQTAKSLAGAATIAAAWWANIAHAAIMPIDKLVDWLEGAYEDR